jgi:hypothetical protein
METDAKDLKRKGAWRDAKGSPGVTYTPRPDASPEGELTALAAIFAFVIQAHERNIVAAPANESRKEVDTEERRQGQDR